MLALAVELAKEESLMKSQSKFFEPFVNIAHAMNDMAPKAFPLGQRKTAFPRNVLLNLPSGATFMKIRQSFGGFFLFFSR